MKFKNMIGFIGTMSVVFIAFISCSPSTGGNASEPVTKENLRGVWEVKKTTYPLYQDNLPYGLDPNPEKSVPGAEVRTYMYFDNENLSFVKKISGMPSAEHNGSSQVILGSYEVFSDNSLKLNITGVSIAPVFSCTRRGNTLIMSAQGQEIELQKTSLILQMLTDGSGASSNPVTPAALQGVWKVKKMGGKDFPFTLPSSQQIELYYCFNGSDFTEASKINGSLSKNPMGGYEAAGDNKIKFNLSSMGVQITAIHSCMLKGNTLIIPGMAQLELQKTTSPTITDIINAPYPPMP